MHIRIDGLYTQGAQDISGNFPCLHAGFVVVRTLAKCDQAVLCTWRVLSSTNYCTSVPLLWTNTAFPTFILRSRPSLLSEGLWHSRGGNLCFTT